MKGSLKASDHIAVLLCETARYGTIKERLYHWATSDGGKEWHDGTRKQMEETLPGPILLQGALQSFRRIVSSRRTTWDNRGQGPVQEFLLPLEEDESDNQAVNPIDVLQYIPRSAL